ncbi:MAG TPA: DegQ family serine endoprotease [Thermodesulfovibrionales bacterium]|nr:DegQ family serine endoprotease [Thermodesulfovibrionales bacterium]
MHKKRMKGFALAVLAAFLFFFMSGVSGHGASFWDTLPPSDTLKVVPLTNETVVKLVEMLKPAVVNISVTQTVKSEGAPQGFHSPFGDDEFWKRFFGNQEPREFKRKGLGSGFIIGKEGYIVTNNHVVQKANDITVILSNKKQYPAKVIGSDPKTDIALIKIETEDPLTAVPLGDSDKLKEGEAVIAIGNPFGLSETVTAGIVSAKGRVIGAGPYDDFIQTDASINPGNSGGPLLNFHGEVIGINTAIIASGQGIGFAVPINMAKEILLQLRDRGKVTRGWLGVSIQEVTPDIAKSFGLKETTGALVSDIVPDSPAEKAGFKRGDVILEMNGRPVRDYHDLPRMVAVMSPDEKVTFKVLRNGKEETITAVIGEMKEGEGGQPGRDVLKQMGMSLQPVTPEIAKELGMKKTEGIVITNVEPNSTAVEAGIQRGDVILEVNRQTVNTLKDFDDAVQKAGKAILFLLYRSGATFYVSLQIADQK